MGFSNFKIEGRGLGSALILEFLLYYMTKPQYQLHIREKIYLDSMLDLFWVLVSHDLKQQLAETKGIFKGKERKAPETQIQQTEREIADKLDKPTGIMSD